MSLFGNKENLYAQYVSDQNAEQKRIEKEERESLKRISFADIAVVSLMRGRGVTHISCALANFLSRTGNKVALVSETINENQDERKKCLLKGVDVFSFSDSNNLRKNYNFIVRDIGILSDASKMRMDCSKFIMICSGEEEYFKRLYQFVRVERVAQDVVYLFNIISKERKNEALSLMSKYDSYALGEIFDVKLLSKNVEKVFTSILSK